jgi:hypothetical protein
VFNHNHKAYEKKMVELLGGEGFDVIIEHLANINLGHDVQMLKNGARIMVVGCRGSVNINPRHLMLPEASIHGVALGNSTPDEYKEMGCAIVAGIEAGYLFLKLLFLNAFCSNPFYGQTSGPRPPKFSQAHRGPYWMWNLEIQKKLRPFFHENAERSVA